MAQFPEPRKLGHLQLMKVWSKSRWYTVLHVLECLNLYGSAKLSVI